MKSDPILGLLNLDPEKAINKLQMIIPINPDWLSTAKAIYGAAKKNRLGNKINKVDKGLKIFEELNKEAKGKAEVKINTPQSKPEIQNTESARSPENTVLQMLREKRSQIFNKPNDAELEEDFRRTCSIYESSAHNYLLAQAYQEYVSLYHKKTCLYNLKQSDKTNLYIYNTESESIEVKILQTSKTMRCTCIVQFPNGKLFPFWWSSSAVYFNQNVYCFWFGGLANFDLAQNRWRILTPMPQTDSACHSIIFNGNILISRRNNGNLLLYSIEIDSYSTIPYDFANYCWKILLNEERLYLIECGYDGSIYESEIGSDTVWKRIADSTINYLFFQVYCTYNKGGVYIGLVEYNQNVHYYRFDLKWKRLIIYMKFKRILFSF